MTTVREATFQMLREHGMTTISPTVEDAPGLDLPAPDCAAVAEGYGVRSEKPAVGMSCTPRCRARSRRRNRDC